MRQQEELCTKKSITTIIKTISLKLYQINIITDTCLNNLK